MELPILFPAHPRTVKMMSRHGLDHLITLGTGGAVGKISVVEPIGYIDFLRLMTDARLVLTDSGGIQEETTILGTPCLTIRWNTERPITVEMGTNKLVGTDPAAIRAAALDVLKGPRTTPKRPPLWDGKAGDRIADVVLALG